MTSSRPFIFLLIIGFFFISPSSASADSPVSSVHANDDGAGRIQVHGDTVEYFDAEQKIVGVGHVVIDYEGVKLTADKITVYMATKDAMAEGHVVLTQKGSVFQGDRGEFNFGTKVGKVPGMSMTLQPSFYGTAKRVEKVSESHYRALDGTLTTCCGDKPFYKIQTNQMDFYPGDRVEARNVLLLVQGVPVLFIPYYVHHFIDFDRSPIQLIPGKNSSWGPFLLSKWRYHVVNTQALQWKGNVLLDYRHKRGLGGGVENFYKGNSIGRGALKAYLAHDTGAPVSAPTDRHRVQWRHQMPISETTVLTAEFNEVSDSTVIKDFFFREEYERDAFPDNYVSIITAKPEYTFSFLERKRVDDFFTVVDRNPELRFDTHNRQFAETPFYLRQEAQLSNLEKEAANSRDEIDATRFDANHTLSYAAHVGDFSVTPHVGTRQTAYTRGANGERDLLRSTLDSGVDASIKFYKTYDIYLHSFGLDYNQIRHIFTPTASYNVRPNPTTLSTTLQQFDILDAIDKQNFVRFNFENKLQTKERTAPGSSAMAMREIARAIPFFDYNYDARRLDTVGMDAELKPYAWSGIEGHALYDVVRRHVDTASIDFYMTKSNFNFGIGQRYAQRSSNQTTTEVRWKVNDQWDVKVYERYEFVELGSTPIKERGSKEFETTVTRAFDCVLLDFTYNHSLRKGDGFYFVFRLKAFPNVPFSLQQTYNRPKVPAVPGSSP